MPSSVSGNQSPLHTPLDAGGLAFYPLRTSDGPRVMEAAESAQTCLWAAYFPFLLAYADSPARCVMLAEHEGALIVALRRTVRGRDHLDLLVPPMGQSGERSLQEAVRTLSAFNGDLETRILWADLGTAASGARYGWSVLPYEHEYVYSRRLLTEMRGGRFHMLRKRLNRCERELQPEFLPFIPEHREACEALLRRWQDNHKEDPEPLFDFGYTLSAILLAASLEAPGFVGLVGMVDGAVRAFAFGGLLREDLGQFFVLKSDPECHGLAEASRLALLDRMEGCDLVNDAGDLGKPGLAQHKGLFQPVAFVPTFKIRCVSV